MAVSAASSLRWPRALTLSRARAAVPLALGVIAAASVVLRTVRLDVGFWIDEGLSVGIADRPLADIPETLRLDGSPPLYYMVLHLWMRALGDQGDEATHALSLLVAVLAVPVAWALVRALWGARAGWIAAVLFAVNPFLTVYAQETRMYALVVLLALVSTACFVAAFALERGRSWALAFALAHAVLLYTHNWGLFLGVGLGAAWAVLVATAGAQGRRALVRDGLLAAAVIAVLYVPWVPTFLFQTLHTGAPWGNPPSLATLIDAPSHLLGFTGQFVLLVGAGAGLTLLLRDRARSPEARAAIALLVASVVTLLVPWLASQVSPAWATRYLAVAVAPLVLVATLGLARAGALGLAVTALVAALWLGLNGPREKSNVREVARGIAPALRAGDLVISTQPEQIPVLHHYLDDVPGLRWATLTGPVADPGVTDWRDGEERLAATTPERDLAPLLDRVAPGGRVVLIAPEFYNLARWRAPWTALVRQKSGAWADHMRSDERFRVVDSEPPNAFPHHPNQVGATVLIREPIR